MVQLLRGICGSLVPPQAAVVPGGPYPARGRGVQLWKCPGLQGSQNLGASVDSQLPAPSKGICSGDTLAGQRGLLINPGTEAAVFSADVSAEEAITAARWHCLLQPEAIPAQETTGAFPGQSWCELLGDCETLQRAGKDTCPFLVALVTFGLVGSVRGPGGGSGAEGTLSGFLIYQPSGECPGEAAQPLQMGVFPLGGCLWWQPGLWGGVTGRLHHCPAPLLEEIFALALAGAPPSPLSQLWGTSQGLAARSWAVP